MLNLDEQLLGETHYSALSVEANARYEEIRARYKAAILRLHPDKINSKQVIKDQQEVRERFLKIHKAWEILSDKDSRASYDRELKSMKSDSLVYEHELELKDMIFKDCNDAVELVFPCRCGDLFPVTLDELEEMGFRLEGCKVLGALDGSLIEPVSVTIPCSSCSLMICLTIVVVLEYPP